MEVCYWALLFMPLVILHHLLNVFVQLANKRGFTKKKKTSLAHEQHCFMAVMSLGYSMILLTPLF
jgi:hypothetical protein